MNLADYEYYRTENGVLYCGDSLEVLKSMPDGIIQTCITSPPYWGLRDYGIDGQLGLEKTPEEYVEKMVEIFREVRRVLRDDGTLWLNLGDSYWGGKGSNGSSKARRTADERGYSQSGGTVLMDTRPSDGAHDILKPKDLCGIPWRVAFALQADGWYLRSDIIEEVEIYCPCCGWQLEERIWRYDQDREIIWKKPNPMPESVKDRPTKAHEYIFLMSKSAKYFYDAEAIKEEGAHNKWGKYSNPKYGDGSQGKMQSVKELTKTEYINKYQTVNKRTVWTVPTKPYSEAHFATFPPKLIEPCILAGTSEKGCCAACGAPWERMVEKISLKIISQTHSDVKFMNNACGAVIDGNDKYLSGRTFKKHKELHPDKTIGWQPTCQDRVETRPCTVLDPFAGAGTTLLVSEKYGRKWQGIELNQEYCSMIFKRLEPEIRQRKLF